jgi:hypothetical protein
MYFDRSKASDYINISTSIVPSTEFSMIWWCIPYSEAAHGLATWSTSSPTGYASFFTISDGRLALSDGIDEQENSPTFGLIKFNKLNFIVVTMNTSTKEVKFYNNATSGGSRTFSTAFPWGTATSYYRLGVLFFNGSNNFGGIMFSHAVYDSILTPNEISELYSQGINYDLRNDIGNYTSSSNIKGYWKNSGITNAEWADLSGNDYDGTVIGTPYVTLIASGVDDIEDAIGISIKYPNLGNFLTFSNSYLVVNDAAILDITTKISCEAWIRAITVNNTQTILAKLSSYQLEITSTGKPSFSFWSSSTQNTTTTTTTTVTENTWNHICATYDGSNVRLYINGVLDTISAKTGAIDINGNSLLIGALTSTTERFNGYIDSVKVYDIVLSADQILQNYGAEKYNHNW